MSTTIKDNKAYFDTLFCGLVPCKVLGYASNGHLRVKITANRTAYKRGEIIETFDHNVIPRKALFVRSGMYRIRGYAWFITDEGISYVIDPQSDFLHSNY